MTVELTLLCYRIADRLIPNARSYRSVCEKCKQPIWVAYSSPHADHRLCFHCVPSRIVLIPPTPAQMADVADYKRKKGPRQ